MQSIEFLVNAIVFVFLIWHVSAYYEERAFRDRSKTSCRIWKGCKTFEARGGNDNYQVNIPLTNLSGALPENYLVRFSFYVLADSDARIAFSETENPDWENSEVYEIAIGSWDNARTSLSRTREDEGLTFSYSNNVLNENVPLKGLIEITTEGNVRIYIEHSLQPLVDFKDTDPLKIAYLGFGSFGKSSARFYYDCRGEEVYTPGQLAQQCDQTSTSEAEYKQFTPIDASALADPAYHLNLPLYIKGEEDARILLASDNNAVDRIRNGYEIHIGSRKRRRVEIFSIHDGTVNTLTGVRRADIFLDHETLNAFVKISNNGTLELYTKFDHTQYKLLANATDPKFSLIPLNFISFASGAKKNVDNYFNCKFVTPFIDTKVATKYTPIGHPLLLEDPDFNTTMDKRNWLSSRCKYYLATKLELVDFFPLKSIQNSQTRGYVVRFPFYAQSELNAQVVFSQTAYPKLDEEEVYEFAIGGWVNTRVNIRRNLGDIRSIDHQVFVKPILSNTYPVKYVIEVTTDGILQVFAESMDKYEPVAKVYDPDLLPVKYFSFGSHDNLVKFHYDCRTHTN